MAVQTYISAYGSFPR